MSFHELMDYEDGATLDQVVALVQHISERKTSEWKREVGGVSAAIASVLSGKGLDDIFGTVDQVAANPGKKMIREMSEQEKQAFRERNRAKSVANLQKLDQWLKNPMSFKK